MSLLPICKIFHSYLYANNLYKKSFLLESHFSTICWQADLADKVTLLWLSGLSKPFIGKSFPPHIELFLQSPCKTRSRRTFFNQTYVNILNGYCLKLAPAPKITTNKFAEFASFCMSNFRYTRYDVAYPQVTVV